MDKAKLIQFILDGEIDTELSKRDVDALWVNKSGGPGINHSINSVVDYLREKVTSDGSKFTIRNLAPHLVNLNQDPRVAKIVEQTFAQHADDTFDSDRVTEVIAEVEISLLQEGSLFPSIRSIRDIGGDQVEELIGDLIADAGEIGQDFRSRETELPEEIERPAIQRLAGMPPLYSDPDQIRRNNDDAQLVEFLKHEVLDNLGLVMGNDGLIKPKTG